MPAKKQIPLRIPQELASAIEERAAAEGRSTNNMIEQLLRRALGAPAEQQTVDSARDSRREVRRSAGLK
jgi:hypothetical protein